MSIPAGFKYDPVLSEQGREQAEMVGREFGRALEGEGGGPATILTSGEVESRERLEVFCSFILLTPRRFSQSTKEQWELEL